MRSTNGSPTAKRRPCSCSMDRMKWSLHEVIRRSLSRVQIIMLAELSKMAWSGVQLRAGAIEAFDHVAVSPVERCQPQVAGGGPEHMLTALEERAQFRLVLLHLEPRGHHARYVPENTPGGRGLPIDPAEVGGSFHAHAPSILRDEHRTETSGLFAPDHTSEHVLAHDAMCRVYDVL